MCIVLKCQYAILIVTLFAKQLWGLKYKFIPDNSDVFDVCPNQPDSVLDITALYDSSNLALVPDGDQILDFGNVTYIWNIQYGDRIEISYQLFRFDRITWLQTPFGMTVPNICPIMYDKPQYWYKNFLNHVINVDDVKDKCFYPGTEMIFEPFDIEILLDFTGLPLNGRYKIVMNMKAFDSKNVQR